MRRLKIILPILLLTPISSLMSGMPGSAQTNAPRSAQTANGGFVIFRLLKEIDGSFYIEPVVIISGGKYTAPPAGAETDAGVMKKFTDSYFRVDRQYRVIFGGGDAGSLTVQKYERDMCGNLLAEVAAQTSARLGGAVRALAVSSDKIGSGESSRRADRSGTRFGARSRTSGLRPAAGGSRPREEDEDCKSDSCRHRTRRPVRADRNVPDRFDYS